MVKDSTKYLIINSHNSGVDAGKIFLYFINNPDGYSSVRGFLV